MALARAPPVRPSSVPSIRPPCPPPLFRSTLSTICKTARLKSGSYYSRKQVTLHATLRAPHGASRLVQVMSAWWGENPTCSVPAWRRESMVVQPRPCMTWVPPIPVSPTNASSPVNSLSLPPHAPAAPQHASAGGEENRDNGNDVCREVRNMEALLVADHGCADDVVVALSQSQECLKSSGLPVSCSLSHTVSHAGNRSFF